MRATPILPLIFALVLTTFSFKISARSVCSPCLSAEECNQLPADECLWGETRDSCGRRVCAKGPGERCGGPLGILGHCGDGLMCSSTERCTGCSSRNFECWPL